ncbi:MAG: putative hydroxymethylpyrimidine transporter CytX [Aggregatilineales bacterium]
MTERTESRFGLFPKIQAPPEWGIEPVPIRDRRLGFLDFFVLWGNLGIGLLVLLTGSFLVPGLGLGQALTAIVIGSAIGCLLLALAGVIGAQTGVPTMVLLRAPLGIRGSYLPTALNVLQLIGWTIFEMVIMGYAANAISHSLFGLDSYPLWAAVFAAGVILLGLGGPVAVVRQWLKKFAVWIALATTAYLTYYLFAHYNIGELLHKPGDGSLPFWVGVDLVIAMPISWLPLVADYNRFARASRPSFWGTFLGYFVTNIWLYALGALLLLAASVSQEPKSFVTAITLIAGWLTLLILLVDETHNAWADLYSAAVSVQNWFPKVSQRGLILGLGILSYVVAVFLDLTQYESFLLLISAFFVPLFGVLAADYFVLRRRYTVTDLYRPHGTYWYQSGFNVLAIVAWLLGVLVFHVTSPSTLSQTLLPSWGQSFPSWLTALGGSIPSFMIAFGLHLGLTWLAARFRSPASATDAES